MLLLRRSAVIGLVLLSIFTVLSQLYQDVKNWDPSLHVNNPYSRWDERMQSVKQRLPMKSGFVGYFADWDIPGANFSNSNQIAEWYLTQYGLAPLLVVRRPEEWIVGNFTDPNFEQWLDKQIGNYELEYLGFNIYLIHDLED